MTKKNRDGERVLPPHCPSLDPRVEPHSAYAFGASFVNRFGQHQVLAFKSERDRSTLLAGFQARAIKLLDLPGGVYKSESVN